MNNKYRRFRRAVAGAAMCIGALTMLVGCPLLKRSGDTADTVRVDYWEKWQGFEADAIKAIVKRFNDEKFRNKDGKTIEVKLFSVTEIDQKILLATAGGIPPDVAGLFDENIVTYADRGALLPLDGKMKKAGMSREDYLPRLLEFGIYKGRVWGLPIAPESSALHYNKRLFREAGLDPENPPKTIAEFNEATKKLTKFDANGQITQLGFSPCEPGWWNSLWPVWFGGTVWDGTNLTCDSPECMEAWKWIASFPPEYGMKALDKFASLPAAYNSAQNYFVAERVAMVLQGDFFYPVVMNNNKDFELGVAPFPPARPELGALTRTGAGVLAIPKGAKHPDEAWEFIKYTQRQDVMEDFCTRQGRFTPLVKVSDDFYANHPHPWIKTFRECAENPLTQGWPRFARSKEYRDELDQAYERIWRQVDTPEDAMKKVKSRIQPLLDRSNERWDKIKDLRNAEWDREDNKND